MFEIPNSYADEVAKKLETLTVSKPTTHYLLNAEQQAAQVPHIIVVHDNPLHLVNLR